MDYLRHDSPGKSYAETKSCACSILLAFKVRLGLTGGVTGTHTPYGDWSFAAYRFLSLEPMWRGVLSDGLPDVTRAQTSDDQTSEEMTDSESVRRLQAGLQ